MSTEKNIPAEQNDPREIVISRVFDAPRELVWDAMADPLQVVQWWGPRGFTSSTEEHDFRPGGVWKHVMRGPDGTEYPNKSVFKEIVKPERIVYSHGGSRKGGKEISFVSTWTFEVVEKNKTRLTLRHAFPTIEERDRVVREYGAIEGGKQTLERLGELLAEPLFRIDRTLDAPRELVWKAWTDPRQMAQWWGPHNFTTPVCEMDVRVGGAYRIVMRSTDGREFPVKGIFREVVEPERLVMTMDCSEHPEAWHDMVKPNRGPGEKNPAGELLQTVTFENRDGKTRLAILTRFESVAIRDAMVRMGMNEGWSQSLERLAATIARSG